MLRRICFSFCMIRNSSKFHAYPRHFNIIQQSKEIIIANICISIIEEEKLQLKTEMQLLM
uniref:Uncharacterized protein n=1 Tax=Lepeophtheirus salmonis TaxID=72036 RepID=A0A0K2V3F0_LEPSM